MTPALERLVREEARLLAQLEAREAALRRSRRIRRARTHLVDFVEHVSRAPGGYRVGWNHRRLCRALERFSAAVAAGERPRLIVVMPPRHGKTEIVSRTWPVWHLAQNPRHEFACASYGAELADDNSRDARDIARGPEAVEIFPDLLPAAKTAAQRAAVDKVTHWKVGNGASYKSVGVGGPFTGRGAHILCIDDPTKDRAEAESETRREAVWAWYTSTAFTRLAPGGGVIVMATRWHEDDLIGRLLREQSSGGDQWEVLHLEALASEDEPVDDADLDLAAECEGLPEDSAGRPLWRRAGDALHPARFDRATLEATRGVVGTRDWESLYQGRPVPRAGGRIQRAWFSERYECRPEDLAATADEVWVSSDAAKKSKATSDFHAIHVWARQGAKKHLLDRVTDRMGYPEYQRAMDAVLARWAPFIVRSGGGCLIEDAANGTTYLQMRGPAYLGVSLIGFDPTRDTEGKDKSKGARAIYLERDAESRAIVLPAAERAPWVEDLLTWWCAFPLGAHDDDVDAASQLLMRWAKAAAAGNTAESRRRTYAFARGG